MRTGMHCVTAESGLVWSDSLRAEVSEAKMMIPVSKSEGERVQLRIEFLLKHQLKTLIFGNEQLRGRPCVTRMRSWALSIAFLLGPASCKSFLKDVKPDFNRWAALVLSLATPLTDCNYLTYPRSKIFSTENTLVPWLTQIGLNLFFLLNWLLSVCRCILRVRIIHSNV